MSDTKAGHDWANDWQALQRQYWNAWTDITRQQGAPAEAATPWHEGLEQWSRMFGSAGKQSEAAERLMASAKNYLSLMQSMLAFAAGKDAGSLNASSWLDALRNGMSMPAMGAMPFGAMPGFDPSAFAKMPGFDPAAFAKMPGFDPALFASIPGFDASLLDNPMAKALREISGQGLKSFEDLASGAAPMLQQMQSEGVSWLKAPAFGYMREHQEHYQKMALAFVDFQQATRHYSALIMKSSQRSFEILEGKLAERSEPGRQIDSVRALYDLWVDAAEEAYAEIALSDEFRTVYADVVNAQMRVRSQMQQEVERVAVDLGMPSRTELNSVHKKMHELRRELREAQEARQAGAADGRDAELAAMRAEIDDLRRLLVNSNPAPRATAPAPKRAAKAKRAATPRKSGRPAAKRTAAKRSHVATKTAELATPAAAAVGRGKGSAGAAPSRARKPEVAHARAARAKSADAANPVRPVSFADAIAAVRRSVGSGKKRSAALRAQAGRVSVRIARNTGSKA